MIDITNNLLVGRHIESAIRNMDETAVESAEAMAKAIISEHIPETDLSAIENLDMIVRPLALTILASEVAVLNIFSEASLFGIHSSKTMSDEEKSFAFSKYATLNGINLISSAPEYQYAEITALSKGVYANIKTMLDEVQASGVIQSLYIADKNAEEMTRDELSYLNTPLLNIDAISNSDLETGTLLGQPYTYQDVVEHNRYWDADSIKVGGCVDIIFGSDMITETITVPVLDNIAQLSPEYYVSANCLGLNMSSTIVSTDNMFNGIVKTPIDMYVQDEVETVDVEVKYYKDPAIDIDSYVTLEVSDILVKGAYPLLIDITLTSTSDIEDKRDLIISTIESYFLVNDRQISLISPSEIHYELKNIGVNAVISSTSNATLHINAAIKKEILVSFPLTRKDLEVEDLRNYKNISEKTVAIFLNKLIIIKE